MRKGSAGTRRFYNAVVSHGKHQGAMARRLLERGASTTARASLRKFLDWCETPRWHKALNVTPAEWGKTFPEKGWIMPKHWACSNQLSSLQLLPPILVIPHRLNGLLDRQGPSPLRATMGQGSTKAGGSEASSVRSVNQPAARFGNRSRSEERLRLSVKALKD
jgi:hypothetical protein